MKKAPKKFSGTKGVSSQVKVVSKEEKQNSPSNSLKINDSLRIKPYLERILLCFVIGVLLMTSLKVGQLVLSEYEQTKELAVLQSKTTEEKKYWEEVVSQYPLYRDGYFQLSLIAYRSGDKTQAKKYVEKSIEIDPTFEEGLRFRQELKI